MYLAVRIITHREHCVTTSSKILCRNLDWMVSKVLHRRSGYSEIQCILAKKESKTPRIQSLMSAMYYTTHQQEGYYWLFSANNQLTLSPVRILSIVNEATLCMDEKWKSWKWCRLSDTSRLDWLGGSSLRTISYWGRSTKRLQNYVNNRVFS